MKNLILIWFVGNLNTAPLLRQRHIRRVCPRFEGDGRQEPEGSNWGFSIGNTLDLFSGEKFISPPYCEGCVGDLLVEP